MQQPLRPCRPKLPLLPISLLSIGLLLVGCSHPLVFNGPFGEGLAREKCLSNCRATKEKCDADARYAFQQCEAGYSESWTNHRYCQSTSAQPDECGYPWWSCSQNLYGYCSNRYWECRDACPKAPKYESKVSVR
jgi:hypothetical protein